MHPSMAISPSDVIQKTMEPKWARMAFMLGLIGYIDYNALSLALKGMPIEAIVDQVDATEKDKVLHSL
jgi:uncharacterized ferritin-like protein (DUF455 family)